MSHFHTVRLIRDFFTKHEFLETPTPPLVSSPGMEAHLHPFKVESRDHNLKLFLHTSPEFYMKELLSFGYQKIYSLGYCFRDEPSSSTHRLQFLMLEWYRANTHYNQIKEDTLELIEFVRAGLEKEKVEVVEKLKPTHKTVDQLFQEILNFSILDYLDVESLKNLIHKDYKSIAGPTFLEEQWPWEDYFHLLFLNKIEPSFKEFDLLILDEFPAPLAALSTLKKDQPEVCERFEVYLKGIELCNCFNELTDINEQKKRYNEESKKRLALYKEEIPTPKVLFDALERGLPPSSGIALGVERLVLGLSKNSNINPFFN